MWVFTYLSNFTTYYLPHLKNQIDQEANKMTTSPRSGWDQYIDPPTEPRRQWSGYGRVYEIWVPCDTCEGTGRNPDYDPDIDYDGDNPVCWEDCPDCQGSGGSWELDTPSADYD